MLSWVRNTVLWLACDVVRVPCYVLRAGNTVSWPRNTLFRLACTVFWVRMTVLRLPGGVFRPECTVFRPPCAARGLPEHVVALRMTAVGSRMSILEAQITQRPQRVELLGVERALAGLGVALGELEVLAQRRR
jgi:hypothetical protein